MPEYEVVVRFVVAAETEDGAEDTVDDWLRRLALWASPRRFRNAHVVEVRNG